MNFAFNAALAKAAGHQDAIKFGQLRHCFWGDGFRVDVLNLDAHMVAHAGMAQSFVDRLVAVRQLDIFAHHGNAHFALRVLGFINQVVPAFEVGRLRVDVQAIADESVKALFVQDARHFVDGIDIGHGDDAPCLDIGEEGNLVFLIVRNHAVCAAQECIGLNANFAQFLHGVLCRLGL